MGELKYNTVNDDHYDQLQAECLPIGLTCMKDIGWNQIGHMAEK